MTDKLLADAIVALDVGDEKHPPQSYRLGVTYQGSYFGWVTAEQFVRDWRVAGAMIEKAFSYAFLVTVQPVVDTYIIDIESRDGAITNTVENESLPRAINEACCGALTEEPHDSRSN